MRSGSLQLKLMADCRERLRGLGFSSSTCAKYLCRRSVLHDLAATANQHAITKRERLRPVINHHCDAVARHGLQGALESLLAIGIKERKRFIQNQHVAGARERAREQQFAPLS